MTVRRSAEGKHQARMLFDTRRVERTSEALTTEWDVESEAAGFLNLFRIGRESLAVLEWDIRMSDVERDALIAEYPQDAVEIRKIQEERLRTWNALLDMLTDKDRAMEQDRYIDARSEDAIARVPLELLIDTER